MNEIEKTGRPTLYTAELAREICDKVASSVKGIKKLCAENPHFPNKDTIFSWLKNNSDFSDQYTQAKRCQIEAIVDEILEIADDTSNDRLVNDKGEMICNSAAVARSRLQIDTRKWLASKLVPRVYGAHGDNSSPTKSLLEQLIDSQKKDFSNTR